MTADTSDAALRDRIAAICGECRRYECDPAEAADAILNLVVERMAGDAAAAFIRGWQAAKSRALDAIDDWAVPDDVNKVRVRDAIRYATEGDKNGPEAALAAAIRAIPEPEEPTDA